MNYDKKVLIMKETLVGFSTSDKGVSGIARIENENGVADFHLTLINFTPLSKGNYYAYAIDGFNNFFSYPLSTRPLTFADKMFPCPLLNNGFSAGICYVENFIPQVICFGKTDNSPVDYTLFSKKVAEKWLIELKNFQKEEKPSFLENIDDYKSFEKTKTQLYDDEAVATEDYFSKDQEINQKLDKIREFNYERISFENEPSYRLDQKEEIQTQKDYARNQNEENSNGRKAPVDYYHSVKNELEDIFSRFSENLSLSQTFPESKWAKIRYSKDRFYVVGLIMEDGKEKYICYGVPDNQSQTPPKPLEGFCSFLPLPDKSSEGYWMMFQDAQTGKCIKKN